MTYLMSDIHGNYDKFMHALNIISFSDDDILYILGDIVDRGNNPIKIIQHIMYKPNIIPLLGNHEYMALFVLQFIHRGIPDINEKFENRFAKALRIWLNDGGETTLNGFKRLTENEQGEIIAFLKKFNLYKEIKINEKEYILTHAGFENFSETKLLSDYSVKELIYAETNYDKVYFKDKILVTGHTPTSLIMLDKSNNKIYKNNNHIAIDCGCAYGGKLGVFCIDNEKEFYV